MNYIKSIHIEGFKKFNTLDVNFNEHMNILVGENEAGKSIMAIISDCPEVSIAGMSRMLSIRSPCWYAVTIPKKKNRPTLPVISILIMISRTVLPLEILATNSPVNGPNTSQ